MYDSLRGASNYWCGFFAHQGVWGRYVCPLTLTCDIQWIVHISRDYINTYSASHIQCLVPSQTDKRMILTTGGYTCSQGRYIENKELQELEREETQLYSLY